MLKTGNHTHSLVISVELKSFDNLCLFKVALCIIAIIGHGGNAAGSVQVMELALSGLEHPHVNWVPQHFAVDFVQRVAD